MTTLFDHLDAPAAPTPAEAEDGSPVLRPYQLDVLERARARLRAGRRRGVVQGETGSGKTYVGAELCRGAVGKQRSALVIADRRRLVHQFGATLDRFEVPHGLVMSGASRDTDAPVILATRDTLACWAAAGRALRPFDVVVVDECHKAMGNVYQYLLGLFPDAVHVGMTATPARGDGKSLGDFYQWIECTVPASQLVREGWLCKPDVFAPLELAGKRKQGQDVRGLAGDPVSHWRKHADGLPTFAFSKSVAESLALMRRFNDAGIPAEHIDGTHDDDSRADAFDRLARGTTLVLCTVKLCIEGVDVPEVAAAILWSKFGSLVEYRQACGRIMRPKPRAVVLDHAGAAGVHGLPGDDIRWSLDAGSTVQQRRKEDVANAPELAVRYCRECGVAFRGAESCPQCGWKPRKRPPAAGGKREWARDENLSRYSDPAGLDAQGEARNKHWKRCIGIAAARGQKLGAAAAMFKSKYGLTPWSAGVSPLPDDRDAWQRPAAAVFPNYARSGAGAA